MTVTCLHSLQDIVERKEITLQRDAASRLGVVIMVCGRCRGGARSNAGEGLGVACGQCRGGARGGVWAMQGRG